MLNRMKVWTYIAVLFSGCLLGGGCGLGDNGRILWAILNEELFG